MSLSDSLLSLPNELLDKICAYIADRRTLVALTKTCRTMHASAIHALYREVEIVEIPRRQPRILQTLCETLSLHTELQNDIRSLSLNLTASAYLSANLMERFYTTLKLLPNLEQLSYAVM